MSAPEDVMASSPAANRDAPAPTASLPLPSQAKGCTAEGGHRCGESKPDALLAPHMGVVLCGECFYGGIKW